MWVACVTTYDPVQVDEPDLTLGAYWDQTTNWE